MSSTITPSPEPNSARKRHASTTVFGPPASGTSTSGAGNRKHPIANAGPIPIRSATRTRDQRSDDAADRAGAEHEPERPRADVQLPVA